MATSRWSFLCNRVRQISDEIACSSEHFVVNAGHIKYRFFIPTFLAFLNLVSSTISGGWLFLAKWCRDYITQDIFLLLPIDHWDCKLGWTAAMPQATFLLLGLLQILSMLLDRSVNPDLLNRHKQVNSSTEGSLPLEGVSIYELLRLHLLSLILSMHLDATHGSCSAWEDQLHQQAAWSWGQCKANFLAFRLLFN